MGNEYEIDDELFNDIIIIGKYGGENKSGFGVVYLVINKITGFLLALKTLQKEKISLDEFEEFKSEVIPWVELSNHPNIVKAFSIDLDYSNRPYLLMEPVFPDEDGKHSLADFMGDDLSEEQTLKWCIQFCYAMEYVTHQGYFHGDIKPDNILISNNSIKITDFGLTRPIDSTSKYYEGSIFYLAPESWSGFKNIYSDVYAFGMVMYQMINSGKLPYDGDTQLQWENFHKNGDIPDCASDLYPLIKKCLEKDIADRYSSFDKLNQDLIRILDEKYNQRIEKPKLEDIGNIKNMNQGHLAAAFGDVENCKKYYELAISNSKDNSITYNYALDLIKLNEYSDALIQLKNLLKNPNSIPLERIYFNMGICYHDKICLYESIKYYKKAIEINDNDLKARTNLGNVYKIYGLYNEALIQYKYVLAQDNTFSEAIINITDLYWKMGDMKNFEIFSTKIKTIQTTPHINYHRGLILKETDLLKFLTSMDSATEEYSYQIPAMVQLFEFHLENKSITEADTKFNEIFELTKDINLAIELCFSYDYHGFYNEAIIKFDYIYSKSDEKEDILYKKSILMGNNDLKEAIKICKSLLKENIDNELKSKVYINLGNFYSKIDIDKSFDYYLKAYNSDPNNLTSLKNLAVHHAKKEEYFFAEDYVNQGLRKDKNNYDLLFLKAKLCMNQYKPVEAIKNYKKCLKINPTSEVYSYVGACFGLLKKLEIALFYLRLAYNINDGQFDIELFSLYSATLYELGYIEDY